ncbi:hypothetical protein CEXT_702251 [Caerostris extrusa]|uniref:Uncharacterized protein n=1 Tax=Caerostris extrusa TaxID=172846 RepID=A0AAV4XU92_CAEEX|nr:hypothetical protein CEXT_702251 [Caerostris extrusa]
MLLAILLDEKEEKKKRKEMATRRRRKKGKETRGLREIATFRAFLCKGILQHRMSAEPRQCSHSYMLNNLSDRSVMLDREQVTPEKC